MKDMNADMVNDKYDVLGPTLSGIGGELAEIVGGNPDGTFLYAEAEEGSYGYGVFKEEGNVVRYYDPTRTLGDLIWKAWKAEEPNKRWAVMEYQIKGTRFDVTFQFSDEIDPNESEVERRPRALKRRFGDKPVIYPPSPHGSPADPVTAE